MITITGHIIFSITIIIMITRFKKYDYDYDYDYNVSDYNRPNHGWNQTKFSDKKYNFLNIVSQNIYALLLPISSTCLGQIDKKVTVWLKCFNFVR